MVHFIVDVIYTCTKHTIFMHDTLLMMYIYILTKNTILNVVDVLDIMHDVSSDLAAG